MASKSAAAFEEARRKGVPLSGSAHGGHAAGTAHDDGSSDHSKMAGMGGSNVSGMDHSEMSGTSGSSMKGMDHSKMAGMGGSNMSGMDHSKMSGTSGSSMKGMDHSKMAGMGGSNMGGMDHSKMSETSGSSMKGMDHSKMAGTSGSSMKGMDHSKMPGMSGSSMSGMDHSKMPAMSGMQHGGMSGMSQSEQALPDEPAATLTPDPLDAPALTSVAEAQRSAEMAGMMASGEHAMMSHGGYVHQDAGRDQVKPAGQMDHTAPVQTVPQRQQQRKPTAPAPGVRRAETFYTCPMHPGIRSAAPGQCPKCGMALVRKEAK